MKCHEPFAKDRVRINGDLLCGKCRTPIGVTSLLGVARHTSAPPSKPNNSWESGIRKDERGLPFLDRNAQPLRMGESFNSRQYREVINVSTGGR